RIRSGPQDAYITQRPTRAAVELRRVDGAPDARRREPRRVEHNARRPPPRANPHNDRMKLRGFVLQATYRVVSDPERGRVPVIHVYGALEGGGSFLVRDDRQRPHFYVRTADAARAQALGAPAPVPCDRRTFAGEPVSRIGAAVPSDVPPIRNRLQEAGIETFEGDVRFAIRYLIERGIKGGCEIEGDARPGD